MFFKKRGHPRGKAEKEAIEKGDDTPRPHQAKQQPPRQQQHRPHRPQQEGEDKDPPAPAAGPDHYVLILTVQFHEVVNLHPADASPAPAQGQQVDKQHVEQRHPHRLQGEGKGEPVLHPKQGQHDGPKDLKHQVSQHHPQHQGNGPYRQILQEKQPGHLPVFQADEEVSPQLPASSGQHEPGDIGHQPAQNQHHRHAGQDNNQGQAGELGGQFRYLPGEHQPIERVHQRRGNDNGDKIDQVIPGLPPGIAPGEVT